MGVMRVVHYLLMWVVMIKGHRRRWAEMSLAAAASAAKISCVFVEVKEKHAR